MESSTKAQAGIGSAVRNWRFARTFAVVIDLLQDVHNVPGLLNYATLKAKKEVIIMFVLKKTRAKKHILNIKNHLAPPLLITCTEFLAL